VYNPNCYRKEFDLLISIKLLKTGELVFDVQKQIVRSLYLSVRCQCKATAISVIMAYIEAVSAAIKMCVQSICASRRSCQDKTAPRAIMVHGICSAQCAWVFDGVSVITSKQKDLAHSLIPIGPANLLSCVVVPDLLECSQSERV
jgi:hypothetical protein